MRIKDILSSKFQKSTRAREKDEVHSKKASSSEKTGQSGSAKAADSTQISKEARELQQAAALIQDSVDILKAMPSVREEVVTMAKERVQNGYYDRPGVMQAVADIIGEHISADSPVSPTDMATDIIANISPKNAELTQSDLHEIRNNLEKGLYQSEDVVQDVAEKILQSLGEIRDNNQ